MIEHGHPDGEPTPTVSELYERRDGSAEVAKWTEGSKTDPPKPSVYRLTDKGYAILGDIMRRNGAASVSRGSQREEAVNAIKTQAANRGNEPKSRKSSGRKGVWTPS